MSLILGISKCLEELESLSADGIYSIHKIEWWLLKYADEYEILKEEESKRFMYFIDGKWVRLPEYLDAKTPNEKFLHIYETLNIVTEFHNEEDYFKQQMAIYKSIKNDSEKVREWLAINEHLGADKYFMFSLEYFGEEDEMENEIHLHVTFLEDREREVFVDRNDFKYTIEFTSIFRNLYWDLLDELDLKKLN